MTYKEWFTRTVSRFGVEGGDVELILANQQGLIPDAEAEVDITTAKRALCAALRVRNVVANHGFFSCNLTNLRHRYLSLFIFLRCPLLSGCS